MNSRVPDIRQRWRWVPVAILLLIVMGVFAVLAATAIWPVESGTKKSDGSLTIDSGNSSDGYILVTAEKSSKKLKFRVKKDDTTLTYDLNQNGETEIIPLQLSSGTYTCTLYQQTSGSKYSSAGKIQLKVKLNAEDIAYLSPNQYVMYSQDSPWVQDSNSACAGLSTDRQKYDAICNFIASNYLYDFMRSLTVKTGELPDLEYCYKNKMGICQDLSALMVSMLRIQGIPARLVIGYVDNDYYHAWVNATVDGETLFFDPTVACQGMSEQSVYVEERSY